MSHILSPPLHGGSPQLGKECPACFEPFRVGQRLTLVPLGPGFDPEQRRLAREGLPYDSVAVEVHFECATGQDPDEEIDPEYRRELKAKALRTFQQAQDERLVMDALRRVATSRQRRRFTVQDVRDWVQRRQK